MTIAPLISLGTCFVRKQSFRVNFACTKRHFNLSAETVINIHKARLSGRFAIFFLTIKQNPFFLSLGQGVYIFEESPKSIQDVIGDVYCPGKYCFKTENCESLDGYVTTTRSIYGCGKCGAWLFIPKVPFTLQENVKTTKRDKLRFYFVKKMNLLLDKQLLINVPFQSTKYKQKKKCVDKKLQKTIGNVFCPTCRKTKCVFISGNNLSSFYNCKKCKACCHVLNNSHKDQKRTNMLFGGDGTYCLHGSRLRKRKAIFIFSFLKKLHGQSQSSTPEPETKRQKSFHFRHSSVAHPLVDTVDQRFNYSLIFYTFNL